MGGEHLDWAGQLPLDEPVLGGQASLWSPALSSFFPTPQLHG